VSARVCNLKVLQKLYILAELSEADK